MNIVKLIFAFYMNMRELLRNQARLLLPLGLMFLGGCTLIGDISSVSVASVSSGVNFSCAITENNKAYCWGNNEIGQLGNGTKKDQSKPVRVSTTHSFLTLDSGLAHTCGIANDGIAYCWGSGRLGQLGNGTTRNQSEPVPVSGDHRFTTLISAGEAHTCAIGGNGEAYCWGQGSNGELGNGSWDRALEPVPVAGGYRFASISSGTGHTCGVTFDGRALCWGWAGSGALGNGSTTRNRNQPIEVLGGHTFVSISSGAAHTCGLTRDGVPYCWGAGDNGQLGNGSGGWQLEPVPVETNHLFAELSSGGEHTCGITTEGEAWCWGWGELGQLGNGSLESRFRPTLVATSLKFEDISAGPNTASLSHTCGVTIDGNIYCWGRGKSGQLGHGSMKNQSTPVRVSFP